MSDLTSEELRGRARAWCVANLNPFSEWTIDELTNAFTALVAEARLEGHDNRVCTCCHERLGSYGAACHACIAETLARRDAEARRAQREADARFVEEECTHWNDDLCQSDCIAAAIRAQERV